MGPLHGGCAAWQMKPCHEWMCQKWDLVLSEVRGALSPGLEGKEGRKCAQGVGHISPCFSEKVKLVTEILKNSSKNKESGSEVVKQSYSFCVCKHHKFKIKVEIKAIQTCIDSSS